MAVGAAVDTAMSTQKEAREVPYPHTLLTDKTFAVTTTGAFPPSSMTVGVRCSAAARLTILPTFGLPVKKMKSHLSASSA